MLSINYKKMDLIFYDSIYLVLINKQVLSLPHGNLILT